MTSKIMDLLLFQLPKPTVGPHAYEQEVEK